MNSGRSVTQWAMIDLTTRSAVDLSWVGREHNDAVVAVPPPAEKPRKIREVKPTRSTEHRVVYSDIDFNRHVNTMRYIEMMLDISLPLERLGTLGGSCPAGYPLPEGVPLRTDADGGVRGAGAVGAVRDYGRRSDGGRTGFVGVARVTPSRPAELSCRADRLRGIGCTPATDRQTTGMLWRPLRYTRPHVNNRQRTGRDPFENFVKPIP